MVGVKQGGKATFVKSVPTGLKAIKAEVQGLNLLRTFILQHQIPYLQIPTVFSSDEINIELERIDSHQPTFEQFRQLGQGLAKLHNVQAARYGLGQDNFIGLAPQLNAWSSDWGDFFLSKRLQQQVEWITNHKIREEFRQTLKQVGKKLSSFLNEHCAHASLYQSA